MTPCCSTYHSLSRLDQGFLPVAHSKTTQPKDQISMAPCLPRELFLMTSGDMYIGVPVRLLLTAPGPTLPFEAASDDRRDRWMDRWFLARIFAAPKSTNLITPI